MTTDELLTLARIQLRDQAVPPKWSDETIVRYLNEGQEKVSRTVSAFVLANEPLDIAEGEDLQPLPDYIQNVFKVVIDGCASALLASTDNWTPSNGESSGLPTRYTLDSASQSIRFWPVPDADYTATMRVSRYPAPLSVDSLDTNCELLTRYQLSLVDWAAYRCFTHDDADGRNDGAAKLAKDRYEEEVADHKQDIYRFRTGNALRVGGNRII